MPKIAYSRTLQHAEWNATLRREVDPDEIRMLKQQPGGDMVVVGASLAATFSRCGLIDEYHIYMQRVVLGAGHPLFPPSDTPLPLKLVHTRRFGNGVALLNYTLPTLSEPSPGRTTRPHKQTIAAKPRSLLHLPAKSSRSDRCRT